MSNTSLLALIRKKIVIDVDSMDPAVAVRHSSQTFTFCDMTSNQAIVLAEASKPDRQTILTNACQSLKDSVLDIEQQVETALVTLTALLAKEVFPHLSGKVHAQTSPKHASNTEATIVEAKAIVNAFETQGIPRSRVCIKIPATPESLIACQYLEKTGINTLATCLFSLPQAIAASQAGCQYVAPYFNELRVHFEPKVWREYENPAEEHPMSPIISSIVASFKKLGTKTLVMPASIVTSQEAAALASLSPDHLTLSANVLDQLTVDAEGSALSTLIEQNSSYSSTDTSDVRVDSFPDYLTDGGQALREALSADQEASRKLTDALGIFSEMEEKIRVLLRQELTK